MTVLIRTRDKKQEFVDIFDSILKALRENNELCEWTLELFSVESIIKELFFNCPVHLIRRALVGIIKLCLENVNGEVKEDFLLGFIQLLPFAHKTHTRHFAQYLEVIKEIIISAPDLVGKHDLADLIVLYIFKNDLSLPARKGYKFNDIFLGYDKSEITESFKSDSYYSESKGTSKCYAYQLIYTLRHQLSPQITSFLKQPGIRKSLLKEIDNKISVKYLGLLYADLYKDNEENTQDYIKQLTDAYSNSEYYYKTRFLKLFTQFLLTKDSLYEEKLNYFVDFQMNYIQNTKFPSDTEQAINYLYKILTKSEFALEIMTKNTDNLDWLEKWISSNMKSNYGYKVNGSQEEIIRPSYKILLAKLARVREGLPPNSTNEYDSDEDTSDHIYKPNDYIEIQENNGQSWNKGKIEVVLGEILLIRYKEWGGTEQLVWRDTHNEDIIPLNSI